MIKLGKELLLLLVISLFIVGCTTQVPSDNGTQTSDGKGRAVFAITDAAADMKSVTSIQVTVDKIQVHSATEGWVSVSSESKTYDLLQLKAQATPQLLADVELEEGTYNQVRLDVSSVIVVDESGRHEAKLPSEELKIMGELNVNENSTSTATFDFIADESLHMTGNGQYILAPVVKVETKERADVEVTSDNKVKISGGVVKTDVKVGMDTEGEVGVGLGILSNANLSITQGKIKIGLGLGKRASDDSASVKGGVKVGVNY